MTDFQMQQVRNGLYQWVLNINTQALYGEVSICEMELRNADFFVGDIFSRANKLELTEDNHRQFFIPKGFAHGFAVLSETAVFQYKCDNFYHPEADGGISILDDTLGIDWKIPTEHANLSEKDTKHAMLKDFDSPFDINVDLYK